MKTLKLALAAAAFAAIAGSTAAQTPPPAYGAPIGLEAARGYIAKAEAAAKARGFTMAFAVVEPSGELVAFAKADGTQYGSIDAAIGKARTAARFKRPTKVFSDGVAGGRPFLMTVDEIVAVEGGVPILKDGRLIGALGISGGAAEEDGQIAAAALAGR